MTAGHWPAPSGTNKIERQVTQLCFGTPGPKGIITSYDASTDEGRGLLMTEAQTWTEHEARLLSETREYLAAYPIPSVEIDQVGLVGQHPDTIIRTDYSRRGEAKRLDLPVWEERAEIERGNYTSLFSVVRALIQEEVVTSG